MATSVNKVCLIPDLLLICRIFAAIVLINIQSFIVAEKSFKR